MDFTISAYEELLDALIDNGYSFQTFAGFIVMNSLYLLFGIRNIEK